MPTRRLDSLALGLIVAIGGALMAFGPHAAFSQSLPNAQRLPDAQNLPEIIEPDPAEGEKIFDRQCKQCHTLQRGQKKIGPSLAGLVGRRPGGIEGFGYSQDMIDFGATNFWNAEALDLFLTRPRAMLRRTKMAFPGLRKEEDRVDLIAYLSQF